MATPVKKTFSRQSELPKLPIPALEDTCKRYLTSLEALQTPEQHAKTQAVVAAFLEIQEELVDYSKDKLSYVEEFWDDSYLLSNDSVVLNLNPFFILDTQLRRAANLTLATLAFVHDLRHEVLEPDVPRGTPLDMFQYSRLFGMARIPSLNGCSLQLYNESRHIVVMRRGQFYWFEVLDNEHRPLFNESDLIATLRAIMRDADELPSEKRAQEAMGVLSTEQRRTWYHSRADLQGNTHNQRCLSMIDSALFVLCLDDNSPTEVSELTNNMLCGSYKLEDGQQIGTCLNRWYDKLQVIVCANGTAGVNFEHSSTDGHTVLRFVADIYTELILQFAHSIHPATRSLFDARLSPYARSAATKDAAGRAEILTDVLARTTPKRLDWTWTPELQRSVRYAEVRLSDLICQNESFVLEFKGYGKRFITNHGFSPDAFVQMAFQATYYSLYGSTTPTYEPAMTKAFLRGRTETIRTVQPHSLQFVKVWTDPHATAQDKLKALRTACAGHAKLSKECAMGRGFDRHLYALRTLWLKQHKGEALPAFFADEGYQMLSHVVLSTSNCGNPSLRIFGFGPVVQDGFGIGYIVQDNKLTICASSKHLQTQRFLTALEQYLYRIQRDIIAAFKAANIHATQTYIDHAGNECDIRTGLPISSVRLSKDTRNAASVGNSGYSFYGDGTDTDERIQYNPRKSVGRQIFVSEYD